MLRGLVLNLGEGGLNVLPGLPLFSLVFICIFPGWSVGACGFCLNGSGLLGDKFFSLWWILVDGLKTYVSSVFVEGDFLFLGGAIHVWAVDSKCVSPWTSLYLWFFLVEFVLAKIQLSRGFSGAPETLTNHLVPIGSAWLLCLIGSTLHVIEA